MSSINLATTIHICEDTDGTFDIRDILANVGYTPNAGNTLKINAVSVVLPDGTVTSKDSPLFGKVDADTLYVRPGQWAANYNGEFVTYEFVLDQGTKGNTITLSLRVVVDPVNDAPTGADKIFNLDNGSPVALTQADFGFVDMVEHDMFQSVIITALPTAGVLKLDGVAVTLNTEISAADIQAGKLSFEPSQSTAGAFEIGFKVRDAGGWSVAAQPIPAPPRTTSPSRCRQRTWATWSGKMSTATACRTLAKRASTASSSTSRTPMAT